MAWREGWKNLHTMLFWIRDGEPVWLPQTEIVDVDWSQGITLAGTLPHAAILDQIRNGAMLELAHSVCKQRGVYSRDDVIVLFTNCRIRKKNMPWPITVQPREEAAIKLCLVLDCDIELCEG